MRASVRLPLFAAVAWPAFIWPPAGLPLTDSRPFRAGVDLTSITVTVRDADGKLVTGLPRDVFEISEDGVPQQITTFTHDRVPISLGVLIDTSDSMFGKRIQDVRLAVNHFLFDLLALGCTVFCHGVQPRSGAHAHAMDAPTGCRDAGARRAAGRPAPRRSMTRS